MENLHQYGKFGLLSTIQTILCLSIISYSSSVYGITDEYNFGYNYGCDDAGISDKADRYINKPEAEPSLNSDEFMHGYSDGFDTCSSSNDNSNMKDENFAKKMCDDDGYCEDDGWIDDNQTRTDCISPIDGMRTC